MMIKVISFDIGGTILHSKSKKEYNLKALTDLTKKEYEDVKKAYKNVFQKQKGTLLELISNFCNLLSIEISDELISFFIKKFSKEDIEINTYIEDIIKKLKLQNYKIILFSNNCCQEKNNVPEFLLKLVDDVFYSYDIGYTKSDEESYRYIEKKLNIKKEEFLHIGDTLSSDYYMPIKYGWNALYYGTTTENNIKNIETLNEIFKYI